MHLRKLSHRDPAAAFDRDREFKRMLSSVRGHLARGPDAAVHDDLDKALSPLIQRIRRLHLAFDDGVADVAPAPDRNRAAIGRLERRVG